MSKILIITDSNSGIKQSEAKNLGIFVIPMPFTVNGEEYFEDISLTQEEFFNMLDDKADVKTSQPSQYYLEDLWGKFLEEYDEIVHIPMSSGLSSACENAEKYASVFGGRVQVVNNKRISVTQKESVMEALELIKQGKSALDIKKYLEETASKSSIYIMVSNIKYLKNGGRISPAAATIGAMLKVKPILYTRGGKFEKFGVALAQGQAKQKMLQKVKQEMQTEFNKEYEEGKMVVSVAHTCNYDDAIKFSEQIKKELPKAKFHFVDELSLSVACHIGAGAIAIATSVNNYMN